MSERALDGSWGLRFKILGFRGLEAPIPKALNPKARALIPYAYTPSPQPWVLAFGLSGFVIVLVTATFKTSSHLQPEDEALNSK